MKGKSVYLTTSEKEFIIRVFRDYLEIDYDYSGVGYAAARHEEIEADNKTDRALRDSILSKIGR